METFLRLVNPATWWISFAGWWVKSAWPFIRRNWEWFIGGLVTLAGVLFAVDKLTPDKEVKPQLPPGFKEKQDQALKDHADAVKDVEDKVKETEQHQKEHQQKIDEVIAKPSKDVDDAIDNWNNDR